MKKFYLIIIITFLFQSKVSNAQHVFTENFDLVDTILSSGGWTQINNSIPPGTEIWHNGFNLAISAFNGIMNSYAEATFQSIDTLQTGTINNWLITPTINLTNGMVISFYTSSFNNLHFPDRLELRMNTMNTINVGTLDTTIGDFTNLLLSINPNLLFDTAAYPQGYWGQFTTTVTGLSGPTNCRLAFRYFVTNGGEAGANSSTIGIDAMSVDMPVAIFNSPEKTPWGIYPNPVTDKITLDFKNPLQKNGIVTIYDCQGKLISNFPVMKGQLKAFFNASNLAKGTYSIIFDNQNSIDKMNFIKN